MRKETIGQATLYCGDCREVLAALPDTYFQAIVTDPPHGTAGRNDSNSTGEGPAIWSLPPLADKLAVGGAMYIAASPDDYLVWYQAVIDLGLIPDDSEFWDVQPLTMESPGGECCVDARPVMFAHKGRHELKGKRPATLWLIRTQTHHPGQPQMPVPFLAMCIVTSTEAGDAVLDPFMGSGSTAIAAIESGRSFIGVELDSERFDKACTRIEAAGIGCMEELGGLA